MANRFWVGGAGTWDSSSTTHWSASSGGASGASVPGNADTANFDASSGTGFVLWSSATSVGGFNSAGSTVTVSGLVDIYSGSVNLGINTTISVSSGRSATLTSNGYNTGGSSFLGSVTCTDALIAGPSAMTLGPQTVLTLASGGAVSNVGNFIWPTSANSAELKSNSPGTSAILLDVSGTNTVDYISVKDIAFTGGATWVWGTGYTDGGNNTGITGGVVSTTINILFGDIA